MIFAQHTTRLLFPLASFYHFHPAFLTPSLLDATRRSLHSHERRMRSKRGSKVEMTMVGNGKKSSFSFPFLFILHDEANSIKQQAQAPNAITIVTVTESGTTKHSSQASWARTTRSGRVSLASKHQFQAISFTWPENFFYRRSVPCIGMLVQRREQHSECCWCRRCWVLFLWSARSILESS